MKKTRFLAVALLAVLTLGFVSCDPYNEQYNYNAYQRASCIFQCYHIVVLL